ncbi:MAG: hypothetical protein GXO36_03270 [Chloroflexi bacterium]|nr:hypothetical protein [Chloroflexota bacterium]
MHPCFQEFYRSLGRRLLGPVVSDPYVNDQTIVQYTRNAGLLCLHQGERSEVRLAPLGHQLAQIRTAALTKQGASVQPIPTEVQRIFSQFVVENGGRRVFGEPVSGVIRNDKDGRYEQYFEYLGLSLPYDSRKPELLPYGLWACGKPCAPNLNMQEPPIDAVWSPQFDTFLQKSPLVVRFIDFINQNLSSDSRVRAYRDGPLWDPKLNAIIFILHDMVLMYNPRTDQIELAPIVPILYPDPPPAEGPPWEIFYRYLDEIGLAPYAGPPIGGTYQDPETGLAIQRFERLVVEYRPKDAWLTLRAIGIEYQNKVLDPVLQTWQPPIGGPYEIHTEVARLQLSTQQAQWIWATVSQNGVRQPNVPLFVMVHVDGYNILEQPKIIGVGRTDNNGVGSFTIPAIQTSQNLNVEYWVCAYDFDQLYGCTWGMYVVYPHP